MAPQDSTWPAILQEIERNVRSQQFDTWFRNVEVAELSPQALTLRVPNSFFHAWMKRHYVETIQRAVLAVTGNRPAVDFVVHEAPGAPDQGAPPAPSPPSPSPRPATLSSRPEPRRYYPTDWTSRLNKQYVFSTFVAGASNVVAHAAARAIAENPGQAYNPFFLHGGVGLGKTHLIQAITHQLLELRPDLDLLYLSCENFMNHFISAVQNNEREKFRGVYRNKDVLLIDDIHFLCKGAREVTQEEFFHTFNALYNAGKQIVLSSDSPPQELTKLEERLVSRFKWGLVARVDLPSYEMRLAILKKKAQLRGRILPDEVLRFIAENVDTSVRDLEGAVVKVVAFSSLTNRPVDLQLTRDALRDTVNHIPPTITVDDIIKVVMAHFHIKLSDLQSKRRSQSIALPRQIAMHLTRILTRHSLEEIGGYFGGRDHTTVMHACNRVRKLAEADPSFADMIEHLTGQLRSKRQTAP
ncbi:MAG TPA: chromosomal replication initiator protein DnaA [Planctomycetota bacterium]|nr:chromosomal replication initiator protein DnaA [Planctomycetota bacterium]